MRVLAPFNNIATVLADGGDIPIAPVLATGMLACIDALTHSGCVHGIFRESGKLDEVRSLFNAFLRGSTQVPPGADVHAVAGCLKKLLRELPETLFTNRLYEQVIAPNPNPPRVNNTHIAQWTKQIDSSERNQRDNHSQNEFPFSPSLSADCLCRESP